MSKLLIIKAGCTFPEIIDRFGDFEDWILAGMNLKPHQAEIWPIYNNTGLPEPAGYKGIIITGSHNDVTEHLPWMESFANWATKLLAGKVPVLGICFGHQLLAYSFGGEVGFNPMGKEFGTITVHLNSEGKQDLLLSILSDIFRGHTNHSQTVIQLPENSTRLASSKIDKNHAFRIGSRIWGVQFHPEYTSTIMNAQLVHEGEKSLKQIQPNNVDFNEFNNKSDGSRILNHFREICGL